MQGRTHNCGELRLSNAGEQVRLVGWYENIRKVSKNLGFLILRDFYGTTQIVVETEEIMEQLSELNYESTIQVDGVVRERSSKNNKIPTGDIEVVPSKVEVLGKCRYNELPFQINHSKDADENIRLKYRYLDLRNPEVKSKIVLRSKIVADLRQSMTAHDFMEITTDPDLFFTGGSERLSGAVQKSSWKILCTSAGTAAVQTASDGFWI